MTIGISSAGFYGQQESEDNVYTIRTMFCSKNNPVAATCEIFLETPSEYTPQFATLLEEKMKSTSENLLPLSCVSVHPKGTQFEQDLFGKSRRQVEDAFSMFTRVVETGQQIGAKYYVFHGPFGVHTPMQPSKIYNLENSLARMWDIAAAHQMEVLWEGVHWASVKNCSDIMWMKQHFPQQNFVLDVKQAILARQDEEKAAGRNTASLPLTKAEKNAAIHDMMVAMGNNMRHIHLLDIDSNGQFVLPFQGIVDMEAFLSKLNAVHYGGAIIVEPYSQQTENRISVMESMEKLKNAVEGMKL